MGETDRDGRATVVVVQISRGMAPAHCIAHAADHARLRDVPYHLVSGRPAAEAKNEAVHVAQLYGSALLLIEDDCLAPGWMWDEVTTDATGDVLVGAAPCRNGECNVYRGSTGRITYAGSVFLLVPRAVLDALAYKPLFEAMLFRPVPGMPNPDKVEPIGPDHSGCGSDVHFWWRLRSEMPEIGAREIGEVTHIRHPYNTGAQILCRPQQFEAFTWA